MKKYKQTIVANWKLKLNIDEAVSLANELKEKLTKEKLIDKKVVLCPSFLTIREVAKVLKNTNIALGAQDAFSEDQNIATSDLKTLGCEYIIVGHSDRRAMGDTDKLVNKKARAVLANNMIPIICVGETLEEYNSGKTKEVLARQVSQALDGFDNKYFILAYEPVWSISTSGSGKVITPKEAIKQIQTILENIPDILDNFDIAYGGSVNPDTVADFSKDFAGSLVGGASLKAQTFFDLIQNS
ncbi:MAG: triose-phosphate isomerase [Patescibacteria group bacterium]|jgi:triosephosphate isomerase